MTKRYTDGRGQANLLLNAVDPVIYGTLLLCYAAFRILESLSDRYLIKYSRSCSSNRLDLMNEDQWI